MSTKSILLAAFFLSVFSIGSAKAKIWQVGPTRSYLVPSAVANLVADGDTVEIDAGLYTGNVAKWFANNLVIRGVGNGYAHLAAGGNNAEGKAIWVIKGADCTVEGIEFSGCQVPDHNGAGIRQEGKNLTLRNCYFHHNEMGILTSNDGVSEFYFESCEFANNGYGDGFSHNIYVGAVRSLTMFYCYSHDAHTGHLVKSRARFNNLYYNRFTGETGDGSYEVDMPNGGQAILIGNLIEQCPTSQNGGIISFGLENQNNPEQQIILSHNTVVNDRFDGRFMQFSNATTLVKLVNNLFLGPGTLMQGTTAVLDTTHNIRLTNIAAAMLTDPANYNYRLLASSPCVNAGIDPGSFNNVPLTALYAYLHPLGRTARWYSGSAPDVGAYEHLMSPYRSVENEISDGGFTVAPNPVGGDEGLTIQTKQPLSARSTAFLFDIMGNLVQKVDFQRGQKTFQMHLENLPTGTYFLMVQGLG
ncbi:MAG: T9SS type A sorting domain-containing protein, partial [Phycisphaerae bacterium]|nr:T9SS type A sorting domain-containing protein [Saprospiraceae bacterium]